MFSGGIVRVGGRRDEVEAVPIPAVGLSASWRGKLLIPTLEAENPIRMTMTPPSPLIRDLSKDEQGLAVGLCGTYGSRSDTVLPSYRQPARYMAIASE